MMDYYERPVSNFLRASPKGLARSPYAVEVNPWVPRGDIEAAIFFRGTIVSALGYIETRLGELAIRCSRLEQYAALRGRFPYSLSRRIQFLRRAFELEPLSQFASVATKFLDRVEEQSDIRNLVAHAQMQVLPDWGATFRHFPESDESSVTPETTRLTLDELEVRTWRIARLSRLCQKLMDELDRRNLVPARDYY